MTAISVPINIKMVMNQIMDAFAHPPATPTAVGENCQLGQIGKHRLVLRELLFFPQICVKPRKLNVSGLPSPRRWRSRIANGPNSSRGVFSGCSSRSNFRIRSVVATLTGGLRMTRGRCGSLFLHRVTLHSLHLAGFPGAQKSEHDDYRRRLPPELSDSCIFN